jgi:protection-of-telomeres protein 1
VDSLADILKWKKIFVNWEESPNGAEYLSPFDVAKYRASVRVINYFPDRIEDFAVGRRESIYEMLPDYSGGEDTDVEESMASFRNGKGFPKKTWTWRFALEVEDATPSPKRERTWLIVDNPDGQMLLGLDASE